MTEINKSWSGSDVPSAAKLDCIRQIFKGATMCAGRELKELCE